MCLLGLLSGPGGKITVLGLELCNDPSLTHKLGEVYYTEGGDTQENLRIITKQGKQISKEIIHL